MNKDSKQEGERLKENSSASYLSQWMTNIPGHILWRDLIIPGSHNSNSDDLNTPKLVVPFSQCQKISITDQLRAGIRYLDIRFAMLPNKKVKALDLNK